MNKVGRVTLLLLVFFCHVTNYKRKLKTKTVWYLTDLYIRVHGGFFCSMSHKDEIKESAIFVLHQISDSFSKFLLILRKIYLLPAIELKCLSLCQPSVRGWLLSASRTHLHVLSCSLPHRQGSTLCHILLTCEVSPSNSLLSSVTENSILKTHGHGWAG